MSSRHTQARKELKVLDAVTLAADRTSDTFAVSGYNQLIVYGHFFIDTSSSTTAIDMYIDVQPEVDNDNWYTVVEEDVSAPPTVTVNVEGGRKYSLTWTTENTTHYFAIPVPIFGENCRIRIDQTGDDSSTTQVLTMYAGLSNQ